MNSFHLRYEQAATSGEHDNEHSCCIKYGNFVDKLSNYQVRKVDTAPRSPKKKAVQGTTHGAGIQMSL